MSTDTETGGYRDSTRATVRFALWTVAWVTTLALARFGPEHWWDPQQALASSVAVAANLAAGIGWIIAFTRFLQAIDELQRKILQDALAITLGVGWVAGFAYVVADRAGLVTHDVGIAVFPVVLGVTYLVAVAAGRFRYR